MVRHRIAQALATIGLALATLPAAAAPDPLCDGACDALVREAGVLQSQGKYNEALARLKAAKLAAPRASTPPAFTAYVLMNAADVDAAQADALRAGARSEAQAALRLAENPLAYEVLRMLDTAAPPPLHVPLAAAARAQHDAEVLFAQRRYDEALAGYQEALRLDPQFSLALVGAGDCWYMRQEWAKAEALFRSAAELEPRNAQAWRFLADTLAEQGKRAPAERALESGIAGDPGQQAGWSKLAQLRQADGKPLKALHLQRGTRVTVDRDGKVQLMVDADLQKRSSVPDNGMRLALGVFEANARKEDPGFKRAPYDIELAAWRGALKSIDEIEANGGGVPGDPALVQMRTFARDGQLEAAILLLLYRESYQPALEAWLQAHPDGVRAFVDRYGMRP